MTSLPAKLIALLTLVCLGVTSCGGGGKSAAPTNPDEQAIQQMILVWLGFLEAGDDGALEALFDPAFWTQSPTRSGGPDFAGNSLSASSVLVGAEGNDATASFTLNVAGGASIDVTWILQKVEGDWLITYEEWAE
jgi:hypothetical protein